jgi:hypothetical protein
MKLLVAVAAATIAVATAAPRSMTAESRLKDRAAMLVYDGRDRVIATIPHADSANLALIMLKQWEGDAVPRQKLAGRPCVGIALFSRLEWAQLTANGRKPSDIRPSEATMRLRLYPAVTGARAVVEDIGQGTAHIAIGLEEVQNWKQKTAADSARGPFRWSIQAHLDRARGPCTAE